MLHSFCFPSRSAISGFGFLFRNIANAYTASSDDGHVRVPGITRRRGTTTRMLYVQRNGAFCNVCLVSGMNPAMESEVAALYSQFFEKRPEPVNAADETPRLARQSYSREQRPGESGREYAAVRQRMDRSRSSHQNVSMERT